MKSFISMEKKKDTAKRLHSSLQTSAENFLKTLSKTLNPKPSKPSLKTLIHSLSSTSSQSLISTLPLSLLNSIALSISKFKNLSSPNNSPQSPPSKSLRRSSRHKPDPDPNSNPKQNPKLPIFQNLQIYAYVTFLCVSHPKNVFSALDLLPCVRELHDNLILFEDDAVLLSEIANLCEVWWKEDFPGKETLISQSLPFLVSKSLTLKKKVDVHRVYLLREAFVLFDFEDESIEDLKLLLIRCVISPVYLKNDDGRKFIAFLFGLSGQVLKEALAMIRSQIPFGRKSVLEAYSEIVFRGWKVLENEGRDEIENGFLHGLVESGIYASSGSLAASIRRVLGEFVVYRTMDGVEKLLFRLAEPLIFRSMQVANSNVRQNALHLLLDLFPLEDPDSTKEVKDTLLDKQFFLLERLLTDECPDVRVVAVEGSFRILHMFWEIIPSSTITKMITKIFDDMTHDACNEVRLSTLNGIMYLLGNPQSHEILKVLLPRLGHMILDSALSIRAAVVDLLLLIRDIRTFQFHKVVRLDALLSALANDQRLVAQKIAKLLIPSYFPSKITPEEACNRCVTLIKRSPIAGARFCEFALSEGASLQSLLKLFKVLINLALSPDNLDADQIDGLLIAASYLCINLVSDTSYNSVLKEELSGQKLKRLFLSAATGRAQSSVCDIVSAITPEEVDGLLEESMGVVTNCTGLNNNTERQAEVRSTHKMMLSCDWFDEMFEALTRVLRKTAYGCHIKFGVELSKHDVSSKNLSSTKQRKIKSTFRISSKRKHAVGKKSSSIDAREFEEDYAIAVGIAWQIKDLLICEDTRKAMLECRNFETALFALKVISEVSIVQCLQCDYMDTSPILAYTALTLHMSFKNIRVNGTNNQGIKNDDYIDGARSSLERNLLDQTMDHLLDCTNKLLGGSDYKKAGNFSSKSRDTNERAHSYGQKHREPQIDASNPNDDGSNFTKQKRTSNMVKMLTTVLKFIVDATSMDLVFHNKGRCLKFAVEYIEFVISHLRQYFHDQKQCKEEDLKDTFLCLKSSFTYSAKLLNLILKSSSEVFLTPPEAYHLANDLFDLIILIEENIGYGYAARVVNTGKEWLPDLILGLASSHLPKQTPGEMTNFNISDLFRARFPSWLSILAKIELFELLSDIDLHEEAERVSKPEEFPAFQKFLGMAVQLLRADRNVLDAVGVIFLKCSIVGLEEKDFELVLGLLHFVCVKLVRHDDREWEQLDMMLASLGEIFKRIIREAEELQDGENNGKQKLQSARELLEPIWMYYIYETEREPMSEE